jgi:hypothetical protein
MRRKTFLYQSLPLCLLLTFLLAFSPPIASQQPHLVNTVFSLPAIVCSGDADSLTQKAASELASYLRETYTLPSKSSDTTVAGKYNFYLGKDWLPENRRQQLEAATMDDAFLILVTTEGAWLAGKKPIGDLYAVYTLLEEYLGSMFFTPNEEMLVDYEVLPLPLTDKLFVPAFDWRVPSFQTRFDRDFANRLKVSSFDEWGPLWVHTFHRLIPPETYFDEHPEYFALVDGRRLKDGQLCLGNPEVITLLTKNLGDAMAKKPDATYWSVSQNDCYNYCECDLCQAKYEQYGSFSGAYIEMANEIAAEYPDKQISTLAYQFTRSAPVGIKPLPNVNVMFCSIECNRSMPLAEDPRSADFVAEMKDWALLTDNIFVWDYVVQFSNFITPFPNFHVLQPNIQFFKENGARMMFQQGSGRSWSDMMELKMYVVAKLLWNPYLDMDSLVSRFITYYYGDAAPYIQRYYDIVHQHLIEAQKSQILNIYGFPVFYINSFLKPEYLIQYDQILDSAERAVSYDWFDVRKVLRVRLPVEFAILDISLNTNPPEMPWVIAGEDGTPALNPEMQERLNYFRARCELVEISAVNERLLMVDDWVAFAQEKSARMVAPNLLEGAEIRSVTTYSPKYRVGGEAALTDRLFGGLDFRFNWLGYEGDDMVILVDLGKRVAFSSVRMNFLKAVESWVFLPEEITIEVSDNNKFFRQVASIQGDNSDQGYLVKSIPYQMEFKQQKARYLKITARSMKTCPDWHRGYGRPSWIFVDEIQVNE